MRHGAYVNTAPEYEAALQSAGHALSNIILAPSVTFSVLFMSADFNIKIAVTNVVHSWTSLRVEINTTIWYLNLSSKI